MKKSELTQLTQVIEHLVAREVRKQLPAIISETLRNMKGKSLVSEQRQPAQPIIEQVDNDAEATPSDFKASLRELFAGTPVMKRSQAQQEKKIIQYAKDPVLNAILNETTSDLRAREHPLAAMQGGYSPSLMAGFEPAMADMGMMEESPAFSANMPTMPSTLPISRPPVLAEGQVSNHAPLEALPEGISALDVVREIPAPALQKALTRNYAELVKVFNKTSKHQKK